MFPCSHRLPSTTSPGTQETMTSYIHIINHSTSHRHYTSKIPPYTESLDDTYRLLDGQLTDRLAVLKQDISHLHTATTTTTLNDWLTYIAFILTLLHSVLFCFLYGRNRTQLPRRLKLFSRQKRTAEQCSPVTEPLTTEETEQKLQAMQPTTSTTNTPLSATMCSTCRKPVSH